MRTRIQIKNEIVFDKENWEFRIVKKEIGKPYSSCEPIKKERVLASVSVDGIVLNSSYVLPIEIEKVI